MKTLHKRSLIVAALHCCLLPPVVAEVVTDGSLGNAESLTGPNFEITADKGQLRGDNLFHSFSQFNLDSSETANFSGPANVQNIISRVTGGTASTIDGTISSSIANANLFLLNPNGILFGPNANLDITGSFHTSTADYLKLGDTDRLYADLSQNTTLSVSAPSAFGFLDNDIAGITVDASQLSVAEGKDISIIGGNISLKEGASIKAADGQIRIASAGSDGEINFALENTTIDNVGESGTISLNNKSLIDASGNAGGRVIIRGGTLTLDDANIAAHTLTLATETAPNIDIKTKSAVQLDNQSSITANLKMFAGGSPGGINIETENLQVKNTSAIRSEAEGFSAGSAGDIVVTAKSIELDNYSTISTSTAGAGDSGNIIIKDAKKLDVRQGSRITTAADFFFGQGKSGDVDITADVITMEGIEESAVYLADDFTGIDTGFFRFITANDAGNIDIKTKKLTLNNNAMIRSNSFGGFKSGDISITSKDISAINGGVIQTFAVDGGKSGNLTIQNARTLRVSGASPNVESSSLKHTQSGILKSGSGEAELKIESNIIQVSNGGYITSESKISTAPSSGTIRLKAHELYVDGVNQQIINNLQSTGDDRETALNSARSQINSSSVVITPETNIGNSAGSIFIDADYVKISNNAKLSSETTGGISSPTSHSVGNIVINSDKFTIIDAALKTDAKQTDGGNIIINSNNNIILKNSDMTALVEQQNGNGGTIRLQSKLIAIDKSRLTATAIEGNGGNIHITGKNLVITNNNTFDVSSKFSTNGEINISTDIEFNSDIESLPDNALDVSKFFKTDCIAKIQETSSLSTSPAIIEIAAPSTLLPSNLANIPLNTDNYLIAISFDKQLSELNNSFITNIVDFYC